MKFTAMRSGLLYPVLLAALLSSVSGCIPLVAAGVGTTVVASLDRRSYGAQLEDSEIEARSASQIDRRFGDKAHISSTSFNRWLLLTGQAPDEATKQEAERMGRSLQNVRQVINEVSVGWPTGFGTSSSDALLTTKVKSRLLDTSNPGVSGHHVKVVTQSGVVYLMGLLTQAEANTAVEIARTTSGVSKVVQIFEIISPEAAKNMSGSNSSAK